MLIALAWPTHVHHLEAADWFTSRTGQPWATTSITQLGFIRVSSNRRVLPDARSPGEAAGVLRALTALAGHEFWIDDLELTQSPWAYEDRLTGYRQVTDSHLLFLAERNDGCVATFDQALAALSPDPSRVHLLAPSRSR